MHTLVFRNLGKCDDRFRKGANCLHGINGFLYPVLVRRPVVFFANVEGGELLRALRM